MKTVLLFAAVMNSVLVLSVSAQAAQNLVLAGDCKPKVEKALTGLGSGPVLVESVVSAEGEMITVAYTRARVEGPLAGEANLVLKDTTQIARGPNVYLILCDVVSVETRN